MSDNNREGYAGDAAITGGGFWLNSLEATMPRLADALCAETDPDAFYPEKGGSTRDAKAVCGNCTIRDACLEWALEHGERFGIWGGTSERDRRRIINARGIIPTRITTERTYVLTEEGREAMVERNRRANSTRVAKHRALRRQQGHAS